MAAPDITALFFDQEEVPMALLFGPETIVPGRRCAISSMGGSFDRVQALEALKAMFPSNLQVIVWKSDTNEPISLESMNFDEMELSVAFRARSEACNILGDSQLEYNNLKAQYLSAINESERVGVLLVMKNLLHSAIFQNLAANALKSYGTYTEGSTGLAMCLLDYRKLFSVDQARVQAIQNRINRALARASLPRIQDDAKPSATVPEEAKLSTDSAENSNLSKAPSKANNNADRAPSGRLRKKISDPSSSSSSEHSPSTSEVEFPVEGCHTDTEREDLSDGNATPLVIRTISATSQQDSQPKDNSFPPLPRIPKKKSKRSRRNSKPKKSDKSQPKKSRVSSKKNKKHKSKKPKKVPLPPTSSSSSSCGGSDSESEEEPQAGAPIDQVLQYCIPLSYLYTIT